MRPSLALAPLVALAGLAGCGGLTNEDLRFLAALPDENLSASAPEDDGQALSFASQESGLAGSEVRRVREAADGARILNRIVKQTSRDVRAIAWRTPSARGEGTRTWGPFALRGGRTFGQLEMVRDAGVRCRGETGPVDETEPRFRWNLSVSRSRSGPWEPVVDGVTVGETFGESCGSIRFDLEVNRRYGGEADSNDTGRVDVGWVHDAAFEELSLEKEAPLVAGEKVGAELYVFRRSLTGAPHRISFREYRNVHGPLRAKSERLDTLLQWTGRGADGRADVRITGGEITPDPTDVKVCWRARQDAYYANPLDVQRPNPVGDVATCGAPFEDPAF